MAKTRQQMGKAARQKGTNFERKVARDLSKYTGKNWRRVPYSGASYIPGDICCLDAPYPLVVELKNRADVKLDKIFRNPNCIQPYVSDTQVLIFNNNGQEIVVHHFGKLTEIFIRSIEWDEIKNITFKIGGQLYIAFDLKDFAKLIKEENENA